MFFCLDEKDSSFEHIFPKAIGGTLKTNRVCKTCNGYLGRKVDVLLTDHLFIQFRRWELSLAGQSGAIPDAPRILLRSGVMANDPEQRVRVLKSITTRAFEPKILPRVTDKILDDGTRTVGMVMDASTSADDIKHIVRRIHRREGIPMPTDIDLEKMVETYRSQGTSIESPTIDYKIQIDMFKYNIGLL